MSYVKLGWGLGFVALGLLCLMAAVGVTAMIGPLVTVVALLVLVGGGNWLSGRSSPHARPQPGPPPPGASAPAPPPGASAPGAPPRRRADDR